MKDLKQLKHKYSGQEIPAWELEETKQDEKVIKGNTRKPKLTKDVLTDGNLNPDLH